MTFFTIGAASAYEKEDNTTKKDNNIKTKIRIFLLLICPIFMVYYLFHIMHLCFNFLIHYQFSPSHKGK